MGLFDKLFERKGATKPQAGQEPAVGAMRPQDVVDGMLAMAQDLLDKDEPQRAADLYKQILAMAAEPTAQYNLGSLYAQGRGVPQDFLEAAVLFHQAELTGSEQAGKLCRKCLMDYARQRLDGPAEALYKDVVRFIRRVHPEQDAPLEANRALYALAGLDFNRQNYGPAAKLFRAAAEFGNDGLSQNYLAVLYNHGGGVAKNDLAALYWFDRAVDNGADVALRDRDGILNAYRTNFPEAEFRQEMRQLANWCAAGTPDIPRDPVKAERWRKVAE